MIKEFDWLDFLFSYSWASDDSFAQKNSLIGNQSSSPSTNKHKFVNTLVIYNYTS